MNFSFKPNITKSTANINMGKYGGSDFLQRVEFHKMRQEKKVEELRSQRVDTDIDELTFTPHLNYKAKGLKRGLDDLFVIYI
jgi:hypothetical protein